MYRNATAFYLILHPTTSPSSLITSSSFFVWHFYDFSVYSIGHLKITTVLLLPLFPLWIPFISFSGLVVVARNSNTMLTNDGEHEHSCS